MKSKANIPAFTLLNFVVGMIITSIIMTSFYTAYQYMHEETKLYEEQNEAVLDALNFQVNLNKDMLKAEDVLLKEENTLEIVRPGEKYVYYFGENYIVKSNEAFTDTFHLKVLNPVFETMENKLVTSIDFDSALDDKKVHYTFKKQYSSEQIINLTGEE